MHVQTNNVVYCFLAHKANGYYPTLPMMCTNQGYYTAAQVPCVDNSRLISVKESESNYHIIFFIQCET